MDPVVHVPCEFLGYEHVQTEVHYHKNGSYKTCPQVEDTSCADQYSDVPELFLAHVGDHCASPLVPNGDICNPNCNKANDLVIV